MSWISDQWSSLTKKWNSFTQGVKNYFSDKPADQSGPGSGDQGTGNPGSSGNPDDPHGGQEGGAPSLLMLLLKMLVALFTLNFAGIGEAIAEYKAGKQPGTQTPSTTNPDPAHDPNPSANPNPQAQHGNDPNHPATDPGHPAIASVKKPQVVHARSRASLTTRIDQPAPSLVHTGYDPSAPVASLDAYVRRDGEGRPVDNKGNPIDIHDLSQPFSQKLSLVFDDLRRSGYRDFTINEAVRTHREQEYLYAHRNDRGRIHVVAVPGTSDHEMGADGRGHAVDIAYNGPDATGFYRKLHQFAAQRGLGPEVRGDRVHVQDRSTNSSLMASNRRYDSDMPSA